jgi:small ubiquitin-related modifier
MQTRKIKFEGVDVDSKKKSKNIDFIVNSYLFKELVSIHSPQHLELANTIVEKIDWTWVSSTELDYVRDYQTFLLCKIASNDCTYAEGNSRLFLSPTLRVDSIWHCHIAKPDFYKQMCTVLGKFIDHCNDGANDSQSVKNERIDRTQIYAKSLIGRRLETAFDYNDNVDNKTDFDSDDSQVISSAKEVNTSISSSLDSSMQSSKSVHNSDNSNDDNSSLEKAEQSINLTFNDENGDEEFFNVKISTLFSKMFAAYADIKNVDVKSLTYARLLSNETPADCGLKDEDEIEVRKEPTYGNLDNVITLCIKDLMDDEKILFKVKNTTVFHKMFYAYADKKNVNVQSLQFTLDGSRLNPNYTPADYGLKDEDTINVRKVTTGC